MSGPTCDWLQIKVLLVAVTALLCDLHITWRQEYDETYTKTSPLWEIQICLSFGASRKSKLRNTLFVLIHNEREYCATLSHMVLLYEVLSK